MFSIVNHISMGILYHFWWAGLLTSPFSAVFGLDRLARTVASPSLRIAAKTFRAASGVWCTVSPFCRFTVSPFRLGLAHGFVVCLTLCNCRALQCGWRRLRRSEAAAEPDLLVRRRLYRHGLRWRTREVYDRAPRFAVSLRDDRRCRCQHYTVCSCVQLT